MSRLSSAPDRRSSYASVLSGASPATATAHSGSGPTRHAPDAASNSTSLPQSLPPQLPRMQSIMGAMGHSTGPIGQLEQPGLQLPPYSDPFNYLSPVALGTYPIDAHVSDFFVPSYLRGSRHIARLQERHKTRSTTQREGRSGRSSNAGSLSTSTSGVNLHKMVPSHRGMTHEIIERPFNKPQQETTIPELPSRWSATDKGQGIEVSSDGSEAKYSVSPKTMDEAAAIRADFPIPRDCGIYYYEVDVLSKGKESQIAIGFSGSKVVLNRIPGWEPDSWAYHGDDGNSFCQSASGKPYGLRYGSTDVIGCGINFRTGCAFYTRNGSYTGTAFRDLKADTIYPTVGFKRANEQVRVNFGQAPFVYDIDGMVTAERRLVLNEINNEDTSQLHHSKKEPLLIQELVAQYLAHDGYIESARAFAAEVSNNERLLRGSATSHLEFKDDPDATNRQRIRSAILEGDVDKALKYTNTFYPSVLQDNGNIYFKLRCRKFIEMIRQCIELQPSSRIKSKGPVRNGINGHTIDMSDGYADPLDDFEDVEAIGPDGMDIEHQDTFSKSEDLMNAALSYGQELQSEFKDDSRQEVKQALQDTFALIAYPDARESSLAPLLETEGRIPVAEELNSAILVSLGKSSSAVLERLYQQSEVLVSDLGKNGDAASLINPRLDYLSHFGADPQVLT